MMFLLGIYGIVLGVGAQQIQQQDTTVWQPAQNTNGQNGYYWNQQPQIWGVHQWLHNLENVHMQQYGQQQYPADQVQRQILNMGLWNVPSYKSNDNRDQNNEYSYWLQQQQQQQVPQLGQQQQQMNSNAQVYHGDEDNTANVGYNTGGYQYGMGYPPQAHFNNYNQNPLYMGTNGNYENYHFQRNSWWRCSEDTVTCFHNLVTMVLQASRSSVCMSGCAGKCRFPHIPQHIASLQQVINRIPQDTRNRLMVGQCEIPRWDDQKEALANSILQKAYTCRVDMTQLNTLEHQVMQEYLRLMSCLESMPTSQ